MRFSVLVVLVLIHVSSFGQELSPREAYQSGDYELADSLYSLIPGPEAKLFRAKSLFALSQFGKSLEVLSTISGAEGNLVSEIDYTKALVYTQLGSYSDAFRVLHKVRSEFDGHNIALEAKKLATELSMFISVEEAISVVKSPLDLELKLNIIENVIKAHGIKNSISLIGYLDSMSEYDSRFGQLKSNIMTDSAQFHNGVGMRTPAEFAYTVLIAMPVFDKESPIFDITRGMYNGLMLALEQHNTSANSYKIFPVFVNTNNDEINQAELAAQKILEYNPALILGPLFSNNASEWAKIIADFDIPMLLPLANSSNLAPFNDNVFQLNPTFDMRGRAMANFAKRMGFDTLAVVAEEGSLGMDEALGFIDKAERHNAEINYSFIVDLEKRSYNAAEFTKYLIAPDQELRDSLKYLPVEAAFFPISGQIAPTLAELILTDLEAQRSDVIILGSEEWSRTNIPSFRLSKFQIYYSTAFKPETSHSEAPKFEESYLLRYGYEQNEYSYFGYDLGNYIVYALNAAVNPSQISKTLPFLKTFKGLSLNVNFEETTVNHAVKIEKLD